jgi:hypothetical protein
MHAAAQGCGFPDDSGIEEDRAGGGSGSTGWRTGTSPVGLSVGTAVAVNLECWRSIHKPDDSGETPGASMCGLCYDHTEVVLTRFRKDRQGKLSHPLLNPTLSIVDPTRCSYLTGCTSCISGSAKKLVR